MEVSFTALNGHTSLFFSSPAYLRAQTHLFIGKLLHSSVVSASLSSEDILLLFLPFKCVIFIPLADIWQLASHFLFHILITFSAGPSVISQGRLSGCSSVIGWVTSLEAGLAFYMAFNRVNFLHG